MKHVTRPVTLRISTDLWERFETLAEIDDRTGNKLAVKLIRDYVNARDAEHDLTDDALAAATATTNSNRRK